MLCALCALIHLCELVYLASLVDSSEEDPVLLAVSLSVLPHADATPINTSINTRSQMEIILSPRRCFLAFWWAFLFNSQREGSSRTTRFYWWQRKSAAAFSPLFLFSLLHQRTCSVCSKGISFKRKLLGRKIGLKGNKEGRKKETMTIGLTMKKKVRGVQEEKTSIFVSFACRPFSSSNF